MSTEFTKVAQTTEIPLGKSKVVELDGRAIAIFNSNGSFYAVDNYCPHKGAPIDEGVVIGTMVICPWHSWTFDLVNGACVVNPRAKLSCVELQLTGEDILIKL